MKKLITLMIMASLAISLQAQDITNELGSDGHFYLNNSSGLNMLDFNSGSFNTYYKFKNTGTESTRLQIFNAGHNCKLDFNISNGTASSPTNVSDGISLGLITANGYYNGHYRLSAMISFMVNTNNGGNLSSNGVPTDIIFNNSPGSGANIKQRMIIRNDGRVGIGDIAPNSTLAVDGSMSLPVNSGTSQYTLTENDYTYITNNANANTADVILPSAVGIKGRVYIIKNTGSGFQSVWAQSGEFIDAGTNYGLAQWTFVKVQSDGSNWIVIGESNY